MLPPRHVRLPIYGFLNSRRHAAEVVQRLQGVPGVEEVRVLADGEVLELAYDPVHCGPAQLMAALEALGPGQHEPGRAVAGG